MRGDHGEFEGSGESNPPITNRADYGTFLASVEPEIVKAVVKPLLGVSALALLLLIVSVLPGLHQVIPATPITVAALVIAVITLAIVGVLCYVAPQIENLVQQKFDTSNDIEVNAAAILKNLDILLAVFIAHWGLAGAVVPFLTNSNIVWFYDMVFLILALIPTARITLHLYRGLDPAAELLTRKITSTQNSNIEIQSQPNEKSEVTGSPTRRSLSNVESNPSPGHTPIPLLSRFYQTNLRHWLVNSLSEDSDHDVGVLTKEERVIQILESKGGRIQQSKLVELTGWSKSTVSRVLSEMKEEDAIVKTNLGQGNLITLPGEEPESSTVEDIGRR